MWLRNGEHNKENYKMKITKAQLKQIIKEELIAIHERAAMPEQDPGSSRFYLSRLKKGYDWLKKKGEEHKAQASLPDDYDSPRERAGAERGGQSKAVPGRDYSVRAPTSDLDPGPPMPWPQRVAAVRKAEMAQKAAQGVDAEVARNWVAEPAPPLWSSHTQNAPAPMPGLGGAPFTDEEMASDAASAGFWKPGMPKPKLPKNWRRLSYKDPRRAAFRDWYKYIKSKRKARERRKALAKLSRDAATLPLSDQSRAKMGDPSAGPWPNVRVPPVDPYDPIIGNRRLAPRYENKITIDSIKELIQEVLSNK
jgi:hypothetical protein